MSHKMRMLVALVICLILSAGLAAAFSTLQVPVLQDSRIENGTLTDMNYGTARQLKVGKYISNAMRTYLEFNISGLRGMDIESVHLILYSLGGSGTTPLELHTVSAAWSEQGLTWNNAPGFDPQVITTRLVPQGAGTVSFNVTAPVLQGLQSGKNTISLMVKSSDEAQLYNYKIFISKENPSNTPVLSVVFTPHAPTIQTTNAPSEVDEGTNTSLSFRATDADADITLQRIIIDGKTIAEANSTVWQPNYEDAGTHTVEFYVGDSTGLNNTTALSIKVNNIPYLVINEFLSYPRIPGTEWIELYNPLANPISVNHCYVADSTSNIVPLSGSIPAKSTGIILNLSMLETHGGFIRLFCDDLLVDSVAYGDYDDGNLNDNAPAAPIGNSTGRIPNGYDTDNEVNDFTVFQHPTPDTENQMELVHDADTDHNGCVSMTELLTFIGLWKADPIRIGMDKVLSAIALWKANPIC